MMGRTLLVWSLAGAAALSAMPAGLASLLDEGQGLLDETTEPLDPIVEETDETVEQTLPDPGLVQGEDPEGEGSNEPEAPGGDSGADTGDGDLVVKDGDDGASKDSGSKVSSDFGDWSSGSKDDQDAKDGPVKTLYDLWIEAEHADREKQMAMAMAGSPEFVGPWAPGSGVSQDRSTFSDDIEIVAVSAPSGVLLIGSLGAAAAFVGALRRRD